MSTLFSGDRNDLLVSGSFSDSNEIIDENLLGKHNGFHIYRREGFVIGE